MWTLCVKPTAGYKGQDQTLLQQFHETVKEML